MILTDYLTAESNRQWQWAKQAGVNHAVIRLPETADFDLTSAEHWRDLCDRYLAGGLRPLVVEPLPNCLHDHIKTGDARRDASIDTLLRMFPIMEQMEITTLCVNFMAHVGWCRTSNVIEERGGALVTGFDQNAYIPASDAAITESQLWDNLTYFLKAVVPTAERHGIKLALHPDDPPVIQLGGISRILTSVDNIQRALELVPSECLGVTLCQGSYAAMGEDVCRAIARFGDRGKLFFVHFRDIRGQPGNFRETFHDNGQTDMAEVIRAYRRCDYRGPVRVDHVPTMAGEDNSNAGYASVGRLFAIGYLKGLLDACRYAYD